MEEEVEGAVEEEVEGAVEEEVEGVTEKEEEGEGEKKAERAAEEEVEIEGEEEGGEECGGKQDEGGEAEHPTLDTQSKSLCDCAHFLKHIFWPCRLILNKVTTPIHSLLLSYMHTLLHFTLHTHNTIPSL